MDINCEIDTDSVEQEEGFLSSSLIGIDVEKNLKAMTKNETRYFKDSTGVEQIGQLIYDTIFTYSINKPIPKIKLMPAMSREFKEVHEYAINGMPKKINCRGTPIEQALRWTQGCGGNKKNFHTLKCESFEIF